MNEIDNKTLTVSQLNSFLKTILEDNPKLSQIPIRGEVGQFSIRANHAYLTLKDDKAEISLTIWNYKSKEYASDLKVGTQVSIIGSIKFYEPRGTISLNVERIVSIGAGSLFEQFIKLKGELEQKGYFAKEHKKPIPKLPLKIAVITSAQGDAVKDYCSTLKARNIFVEITIYDTKVQGEFAKDSIAKNITIASNQDYDLIYLGRGGGSLEDLWAFNTIEVANAIFASKIPIITGIGHQRDEHIADFVADFHAITPTDAANNSTLEIKTVFELIKNKYLALNETLQIKLDTAKHQLVNLKSNSSTLLKDKITLIDHKINLHKSNAARFIGDKVNDLISNLKNQKQLVVQNVLGKLELTKNKLANLVSNLKLLDFQKTLDRGFGLVYEDSKVVKSVKQLKANKSYTLQLADGKVKIKKDENN